MTYDIIWADEKAKKTFSKLISVVQPRMIKAIKLLASNPRPSGSKKLKGNLEGVWRICTGDYRVLYDVDDKNKKVILLDIGHRRNIYR